MKQSGHIPENQEKKTKLSSRSISNELTITLVAIVIFISGVFIPGSYLVLSERSRNMVEAKADEYIEFISNTLVTPLWDINRENIHDIGAAFSRNDLLVEVRILDAFSRVIYEDIKPNHGVSVVRRSRDIFFNEEFIGHVDIALDLKKFSEKNRYFLLTSIFMIALIVLILVIMTSVFSRRILNTPLTLLGEIVKAYGEGNYEIGPNPMPFVEFQNLVAVMVQMGEKITQQMKQLQEAEKKYRSIFNNAMEGIFQLAPDGRILSANPAMGRIFGFRDDDEFICSISDFRTCFISVDSYDAAIQSVMNGNLVSRQDAKVRQANGSHIWISFHMYPIYGEDHQLIYIEGSLTDISQRKRNEEKIRRLNEDLENRVNQRTLQLKKANRQLARTTEHAREMAKKAEMASRYKTEFLSNMSHEIRTPLNAIIGLSELMSHTELSMKGKTYLDSLKKSANFLLDLINSILDFSKIEAGKLEFDDKNFSLPQILEDIQAMFENLLTEKNLKFEIFTSDDTPEILRGDGLRLGQILINLINNAIKFTNEGKISLHTQPILQTSETIRMRFSVIDTGIGIEKEKLDSLFDAFTQADGSSTREYSGTGLGLTISKKLVHLMDGTLWVESEPGKGSAFHIEIPFRPAMPTWEIAQPESVSEEALKNLAGSSILLVEDNKINQIVATELLEDLGLAVTIANDGIEALEILAAKSFDVILMDVQMPRMDGMETTRRIRNELNIQQTPIIALTAHAFHQNQQMCLKSGMNDFIAKPISTQKLGQVLIRWIHPQSRDLEFAKPVAPNCQSDKIKSESASQPSLEPKLALDVDSAMQRLGNKMDLYKKLLKEFIQDYENAGEAIRQAITCGNIKSAMIKSHQIKGIAGNISAPHLYQVSERLESNITYGHMDQVDKLIAELENELSRVITAAQGLVDTTDAKLVQHTASMPRSDEQNRPYRQLLKELEDAIREESPRTYVLLEQIKSYRRNDDWATELANLENALFQFDFEAARQILGRISTTNG